MLGVGTEPVLPEPLDHLAGPRILHSADYLPARDRLLAAADVTVVGSGQSGAEVFLDLLRARRRGGLRWLTRTPAFAPMEYSKLGLEQFTPDYTRFFHGLDEATRDRLVPAQWQLYKAISADTIGAIHDELYERTVGGGWPDVTLAPGVEVTAAAERAGRVELELRHVQQDRKATVTTDAVVCATGYRERSLDGLLGPLAGRIERDAAGRMVVDADYRVGPRRRRIACSCRTPSGTRTASARRTWGWRRGDRRAILNVVCGREVYPLPDRTAFTTFGLGEL